MFAAAFGINCLEEAGFGKDLEADGTVLLDTEAAIFLPHILICIFP
jgi:hypothetical protein